jgi:hypothetical protein
MHNWQFFLPTLFENQCTRHTDIVGHTQTVYTEQCSLVCFSRLTAVLAELPSAERLFVKYTQRFAWPVMKQVKQVKKI